MKKTLSALLLLALIVSCSTKTVEVRSPCVSTEDGPCGPKKPINDWWLNNKKV